MFKTFLNKYNAWRNQDRLQRARKLIRKASVQKIGQVGQSPSGTIRVVSDIHFSIRKNRLEYKYTKVLRGAKVERR